MTKLTIIVGMAGSGKTTLCRQLADPEHQFSDVANPELGRRLGRRGVGELVARLARGEDCVVDAPNLAIPENRDRFRDFFEEFLPDVEVKWIFFEKDVVACVNNLERDLMAKRDQLSRLETFRDHARRYRLPDESWGDFELRPVYKDDSPKFADEEAALRFVDEQIRSRRRS